MTSHLDKIQIDACRRVELWGWHSLHLRNRPTVVLQICFDTLCHADEKPSILSVITTLKSSVANFIEPDFGLLDHLLSLHALTLRQFADVRSERTVHRRNDALLDLLTTEDQCDKFLKALQRTGQQHVVNFITQNGGLLNSDVVTWARPRPICC